MEMVLRWLPVVILVVQALMAWGMWSLKQSFVSQATCEDRRAARTKKDERAEERLTSVELAVTALPSRPELHDLGSKIARLTENLGRLDGRLSGVNRAVDLLNQHHLRVNG
ncbi:MAG: hypothetical protein C0613_08390 [Desulfobulbaceae bacterium]|nr:MAG: hypothetical protein C0613_08390 [Desulfobulbaceae bacterium]